MTADPAAESAPRLAERVRPRLREEWECDCGRPFTSPGGRANHRHACAVARAVRRLETDAAMDAVDAALARLAADPSARALSTRRRHAPTVAPNHRASEPGTTTEGVEPS